MSKRIDQIRANYLIDEFLFNKPAALAYSKLRHSVKFNPGSVEYLLNRYDNAHLIFNGATLDETVSRSDCSLYKEINSLIQLLSLLQLAYNTGFIKVRLRKNEIIKNLSSILDNDVVQGYLIKNQAYLPLILKAENDLNIPVDADDYVDIFDDLLQLLNETVNDLYINRYIEAAYQPFVQYDSVEDVLALIRGEHEKTSKSEIVYGMLRFMNFLSSYQNLLDRLEGRVYLQAAFWQLLNSSFPIYLPMRWLNLHLDKIISAVSRLNTYKFETLLSISTNNIASFESDFSVWQLETKNSLKTISSQINGLTNPVNGEFLISVYKEYFSDIYELSTIFN